MSRADSPSRWRCCRCRFRPRRQPSRSHPPMSQGPMTVDASLESTVGSSPFPTSRSPTWTARRIRPCRRLRRTFWPNESFFIGGAGYWLASYDYDHAMAYGGLSVQWLEHVKDPVGFTLKGLVGGGSATLSNVYVVLYPHVLPWAWRTGRHAAVRTELCGDLSQIFRGILHRRARGRRALELLASHAPDRRRQLPLHPGRRLRPVPSPGRRGR